MSRDQLKKITDFLHLSRAAAGIRSCWYGLVDFLGTAVFSAAKALRILPDAGVLEPDKIRSILLVRDDRIGDLVLSTPAVRAVRKRYPEAKIHLLVNEYAKALVINNPHVDKVFVNYKKVLENRYDLAIALHAGFRQNRLLFISGARWRIGFSGWGGGFFLTETLKDTRKQIPEHEADFSLKAAKAADAATEDKKLEVSITPEGESFAEEFYRLNDLKDRVIVMHPGARQECLRWDKKNFAGLADRLMEKQGFNIILTGAKQEQPLLDDIVTLMKRKPVICSGTELSGLVSIMKRSGIYVGNITGPMHIACALDLKVIAITGLFDSLDDIRYWGPLCDQNIIVRKHGIQNIQIDDVYQAVLKLAGEDE